ncbi:MAG TPA: TonB-dependent receptor [Vicinamibacterales bacterium]|nr:TonB-dependent receptor [Vicinamibacterales bacterium]
MKAQKLAVVRSVLRVLMLGGLAMLAVLLPARPALASSRARRQSPNNAGIVVIVSDQAGLVVRDAKVTVVNAQTGAARESISGADGSASFPALSLTGTYTVTVSKPGFGDETRGAISLRSGEVATLRVRLLVGTEQAEVMVYGTDAGVRADAQIGRRLDSAAIDETPILGRKITTLPLLNSAFRQGKGTGDLFVNATYFITGSGSRRTTTYMLDGASNDEGWGRQTMLTTLPLGAVQEAAVLTNAFSAEFGWTAGPAFNIVTKSGTNAVRGEGIYLIRPGGMQARRFGTAGYCPPSVPTCTTPPTLAAINPADLPDELHQVSASAGGPIARGKTFFFASGDYTLQDRTTFLSSTLPAFVLPANGSLEYVGKYRQRLFNGRLDHKLSSAQSLMVRVNYDRFYDTNPNDAVVGTSAPTVARRYTRGSRSAQVNHTAVVRATLLNEARAAYLDGAPVTLWEAQNPSTAYTRGGPVPFTIGESRAADIRGHQFQFADTVSWSRGHHNVRAGGSIIRHATGGSGSEPGQATLGTFTFLSTTTAPFSALTLADVQQYSQPVSYGITSYEMQQWMSVLFVQDRFRVSDQFTLDAGLRYDRQTLTTDADNVAPRLGFAWHPANGAGTVVRGGYAMYYTQIRANALASALTGGLDGIVSYTAAPGQTGFPVCLTCVPVAVDPRTLPLSQQPARNITIRAGQAAFHRAQFASYGLDFDRLPDYPGAFVNPRSQVTSIGVERQIARGLLAGADYVHQHWTDLDRSVDLNAPAPFDRTAPGQVRTVAAANATRPIVPVNGGVRNVNVLMNLGTADYDGLQAQISYRGSARFQAALSYTLAKATNTTEPDGNGIGPNDPNIARLGEEERGPSVVDQRHRAVITASYALPYDITAGTLMQFASARPFNAVTGIDNNGDGANNDRPVVNGAVLPKSAFRGTGTQDVGLFVEGRLKMGGHAILLRMEGFNFFNHANILGRAQTTYGDAAAANPTFGQVVAAGAAANALPALANIDPPRMFQFQARFVF